MRKKNQRLFAISGLLVLLNLVFFASSKGTFSKVRNYEVAIADTSAVNVVKLTRAGIQNTLDRQDGSWILNQQFSTDPAYTRILLAVLNRVAAKRPLGEVQMADLKARVEEEAVLVELEGVDRSFYVVGNRTFTKTFFLTPDLQSGYEVEIPGYRDFVGGIFQLTADQWRDRLIFRGNFRTIEQVTIDREGQEVFNAQLTGGFFEIENMTAYDTLALVNYLNEFNYLQANERISPGKFPRYDSLKSTTAQEVLSIRDLGLADALTLEIFPALPGENFQLTVVNGEDMVVISSVRLRNWLKTNADFSLNTSE